jgi:hypothetical protein
MRALSSRPAARIRLLPPSLPRPSPSPRGHRRKPQATAATSKNARATSATIAKPKSDERELHSSKRGHKGRPAEGQLRAALIPGRADCMERFRRNLSQNGRTPTTSKNDGAKIAKRQIIPPSHRVGSTCMEAPKNAANVNSGPGTACAAPYPARNRVVPNQSLRHDRCLQQREHDMTSAEHEGT